MTKAELQMLEKLFAAEVDAALSGNALLGVVQSKSRLMLKLEADGYVKRVRLELKPDRLGAVVIDGWQLTVAGNAAYCLSV